MIDVPSYKLPFLEIFQLYSHSFTAMFDDRRTIQWWSVWVSQTSRLVKAPVKMYMGSWVSYRGLGADFKNNIAIFNG